MKILTLSSMYHPYQFGGAETVLKTISEGFVERGHQVRVLASVPPEEARKTVHAGVEAHFLPSQSFYWPFDKKVRPDWKKLLWHAQNIRNHKMAKLVVNELASYQPDIVVTHNLLEFSVASWEVVRAANIPIVHVLHDYGLLCSRTTMFKNGVICSGKPAENKIDLAARCGSCKMLSIGKQAATQNVSGVVGVSRAVLDVHLSAGCFEQTPIREVINNALPDSEFNHFIERDYANKTCLTIGFFGQLIPEKGIEDLLRALMHIKPSTKWKVLIGGKAMPEYLEDLKRRFPLAQLEFLGFIKPADFYPKIDLLIVPSVWRDPFPTVIFEAYSYGVPVVGALRGGIPESVMQGQTGELFEPSNPQALGVILDRFIEQPSLLQAYIEPIRKKLEHFRISRQIDEHLSLYQRVLTQYPQTPTKQLA